MDRGDEYRKTRFNEIHNSYLNEFGYLNQESLHLKIQGKLEDVVVVTGFVFHAG